MALTLKEIYSYASDNNMIVTLIAPAVAVAALTIINEEPSTAQHSARLAWAQKSLLDPTSMAKRMIWGILADPNVAKAMPDPNDEVIQTAVNSAVNSYHNA